MGQCSSTEILITQRNQSMMVDEIYPIQIAVLPKKNQIVLQTSDQDIYTLDIPISKQLPQSYRTIKLSSKIDNGNYISEDNRVVTVFGFEQIKDKRITELLYILAKSNQYNNFKIPNFEQNRLVITDQIVNSKVVFQSKLKTINKNQSINWQQDIYKQSYNKLIMISKPLASQSISKKHKYLNIVQLSRHMKQRGIDWFDSQLQIICKNILFYLQQLHNQNCTGLKAILIGPGADIYLLAGYKQLKTINQRERNRDYGTLNEIIINCLVRESLGVEQHRRQIALLQDNYPKTYQLLKNIQQSRNSEIIKYLSIQTVKNTFVNGYIQSYFSFRHQIDKLIVGYTLLENYEMLEKIYNEKLQVLIFANRFSFQVLQVYEKLMEIQEQKIMQSTVEDNKLARQSTSKKQHYIKQMLEIAENMVRKLFLEGQFHQTIRLCQKIIMNQSFKGNSSQKLYIIYLYRCKAARTVVKIQQCLNYCLGGIKKYPNRYEIVCQLIQCFLIDWKQQTIEQILNMCLNMPQTQRLYYSSYALLIKAIKYLNRPLLGQSLKILQLCIDKASKEKLIKSQILKADIIFYSKDFEKAYSIYKQAQLLCKSQKFDEKRIFTNNIKQGLANCLFCQKKYEEAAIAYQQVMQQCFEEQLQYKEILFSNSLLARIFCSQGASLQFHNAQLSKLLLSIRASDKHSINAKFLQLQVLFNKS